MCWFRYVASPSRIPQKALNLGEMGFLTLRKIQIRSSLILVNKSLQHPDPALSASSHISSASHPSLQANSSRIHSVSASRLPKGHSLCLHGRGWGRGVSMDFPGPNHTGFSAPTLCSPEPPMSPSTPPTTFLAHR